MIAPSPTVLERFSRFADPKSETLAFQAPWGRASKRTFGVLMSLWMIGS